MTESSHSIPMPTNMTKPIPKLSAAWRIVNLGMACFFLMAACANANDGDWFLWMPFYIVPSSLSFVAALWPISIGNAFWRGITAILFGCTITLSLYQMAALLAIRQKMASNPLQHEEGREMGGLLIILTWSGIMRFSPIARMGNKESHQNILSALFWITLALAIVPILAWSLCFIGDMQHRMGHCNNMFQT